MNLLLSLLLFFQTAPPTQVVKARHGSNITVAWDFTDNEASAGLLYFSVKSTYSLNQTAQEFKQVPKTQRQTSFVVTFTTQYRDDVYYTISAIYEGTKGESFPANTIAVQRIGPPPQ